MSKDAAIPGHRNVIKREAENILKYKDLITEIQRMWNVTAKVMPVITVAIGTISESLTTGKARRQGSTKNSDVWNCTQTAGSADVIVPIAVTGRRPTGS